MVSQPRLLADFTTARMTALRPGQSPPPVKMPIRSRMAASVANQTGMSSLTARVATSWPASGIRLT